MKIRTKAILIATLCFISFTAGTALREPPQVITKIKEVIVYRQATAFHQMGAGTYFNAQRDRLAAALPASVLRPVAVASHPRPVRKPLQIAGK